MTTAAGNQRSVRGERRQAALAIHSRQIGQLRVGLAIGALIAAGLPFVLVHRFPDAPRWIVVGAPFAVAVELTALALLSFTAAVRRDPQPLEALTALFVAVAIALLATVTGGFASPLLYAILLIWLVGVGVSPVTARVFAVNSLLHLALVVAIVAISSARPGSPAMFLAIALPGWLLTTAGAYVRERAQLDIHQANAQLAEAQRSLADLNEQLENRVADQVVEILRRERQVETLNVQLQAQVIDRSRQLADAIKEVMRRRDDALLPPGHVVGGRARIVAAIGAGGMGRVYLADDLLTGQRVAVKMLRGHAAGDAEVLARFVAEAAAAAEISHPGVIRTYHVDVDGDGRLFQVMEYVPGVTLAARAARGAMAPGEAARVGEVVADAVTAAHAAGVVHRDIKPANLILCASEPGVRILDFGLSKLLDREIDSTRLTTAARLIGTPRYMSPEQVAEPSAVGSPSDVYNLGLVVYELVAGHSPYTATNPAEYCIAHVQAAPAPLPGAPALLAALVDRCLAKDAAARPTAAQLADQLRALADGLSAPAILDIARREVGLATDVTASPAMTGASS